MEKCVKIICGILLFAYTQISLSQDTLILVQDSCASSLSEERKTQLMYDYTQSHFVCRLYFLIASDFAEKIQGPEAAVVQIFKSKASKLEENILALVDQNVGSVQEQMAKVIIDKDYKGNTDNFMKLASEYDEFCEALIEKPEYVLENICEQRYK